MGLVRSAVLCLLLLGISACRKIEDQGTVLVVDDSLMVSIVASSHDGIAGPDGLLWRAGTVYIADEGGSTLRAWRAGAGTSTLGAPDLGVRSPEDLVMDGDGNIFFSDDDAGGVWTIDSLGVLRRLVGPDQGLASTEGIALSPTGDLLVGDSQGHRIMTVTRDGAVSVFLGAEYGIQKPESMAFDERGDLYIGDNQDNVLYRLDTRRVLSPLIRQQKGFSPESIVYANGGLYITDSKAGRLYRWTERGGLQTMAVFGGALRNVQGITADPRGTLYVSVQTDLENKIGYLIRLSRLAAS